MGEKGSVYPDQKKEARRKIPYGGLLEVTATGTNEMSPADAVM